VPNYGDIRLNLPPDWDRRNVSNPQFINSTIGHRNGVSEVRLKDNPEQRHAFAWVDPREVNGQSDVDQNQDDGYTFVKQADGWIADRWSWDAEGRLRCEGQLLMFLTEENWTELQERRARFGRPPSDPLDDEKFHEMAEKLHAKISIEESPKRQGRRGF
jgi:hypothetical protein